MNEEQTNAETQNTLDARHVQQPAEMQRPASDLIEYARQYAREKPEVVAIWCLGIGFVLGWKLKFW